MKKILILGTGSIGSEIAYAFKDKFEIYCIDHGKHFSGLQKIYPTVNFVKGDIHDRVLLKKYAKSKDLIFYCVGTGGIKDCIDNFLKYQKINVQMFRSLLKSLNDFNGNFFLFSSSYVYPNLDFISECTKPVPVTEYGKLRLIQEELLRETNFKYTILRLGNIFGYGHFFNFEQNGAIEKFINHVFTDKNILLHGDGSQIVDYLFKNDLIQILKELIEKEISGKVYNIGTGSGISIEKLAKIIQSIAKKKFGINVMIKKVDINTKLPNSPIMSCKKIKEEFGWQPGSNFELEIEKMMELYNLKHKGKI